MLRSGGAVVFRSDDMRPFRHANLNWFWGSYTPVYLGVAQAALTRCAASSCAPAGRLYAVARLSPRCAPPCRGDERRSRSRAAGHVPRGLAQRHAGPDPGNDRRPLPREIRGRRGGQPDHPHGADLGGAHGIFKSSRLEQLFRDGALGPLHPPPADFCLQNMGLYELGLDPADMVPPR